MFRSALWPLAIMFIIHRSYVVATNGFLTDDFGPVYRAVIAFKFGRACIEEGVAVVAETAAK